MKSSMNALSSNKTVGAAKKLIVGTSSPSSSSTVVATTLTCPTSNQSTYTASTRVAYKIECSVDRYGEDLDAAWVSSLEGFTEVGREISLH